MYSFSYLEPVCCSMSSSNCCLLTCIQISQEAGQVVWYSRLFQNFPQFIVIHTVKGFGIARRQRAVRLRFRREGAARQAAGVPGDARRDRAEKPQGQAGEARTVLRQQPGAG